MRKGSQPTNSPLNRKRTTLFFILFGDARNRRYRAFQKSLSMRSSCIVPAISPGSRRAHHGFRAVRYRGQGIRSPGESYPFSPGGASRDVHGVMNHPTGTPHSTQEFRDLDGMRAYRDVGASSRAITTLTALCSVACPKTS